MPFAIHFLNKPDETGRPRLLSTVEKGVSFKTRCWKLAAEDVAQLVGGWIYLNDAQREGARVGGVVTAVEPANEPGYTDEGRPSIIFTSRAEAKGLRWRGAAHAMAWTSGLVPAKEDHEKQG